MVCPARRIVERPDSCTQQREHLAPVVIKHLWNCQLLRSSVLRELERLAGQQVDTHDFCGLPQEACTFLTKATHPADDEEALMCQC
jgi:hypothetical protein